MAEESGKQDGGNLRVQMMIILLFLFLFFVALDVFTTQWLILNSPGSIVNEINPVGVLLFQVFGSAGMIFPKFGLFVVFASLAMYFTVKHSKVKWFVEASQMLVLVQVAISLIVTFNNFVAILATLFVKGPWPMVLIDRQTATVGIYLADLALGASFANGLMYIWGLTRRMVHLKVFIGLILFVSPVLLFAEGFRVHLWLFALYVASASSALGLSFYMSESKYLRVRSQKAPEKQEEPSTS